MKLSDLEKFIVCLVPVFKIAQCKYLIGSELKYVEENSTNSQVKVLIGDQKEELIDKYLARTSL